MARPGRPEAMARLAAYLAPAQSDYFTDQGVIIGGGLEMN